MWSFNPSHGKASKGVVRKEDGGRGLKTGWFQLFLGTGENTAGNAVFSLSTHVTVLCLEATAFLK